MKRFCSKRRNVFNLFRVVQTQTLVVDCRILSTLDHRVLFTAVRPRSERFT